MSVEEMFEIVLKELARISAMSRDDTMAWLRASKTIIPPTVRLPDGGSVFLSEEGALQLRRLSRALRERNKEIKAATSPDQHYSAVERALGAAIAAQAPQSDAEVWDYFLRQLADDLPKTLQDVEHLFPCHVFVVPPEPDVVPQFGIGPVRFVPRAEFLEAARKRGPKSAALVEEALKEQRPDATAKWREEDGLRHAIGNAHWVASVTIKKCDREMSRERAVTCVRLALAIIRLCTAQTEAHRLRLETDPHVPVRAHFLSAREGGEISVGWRIRNDGIGTTGTKLKKWLAESRGDLEEFGAFLTQIVDQGAPFPYPKIKWQWLTALYWFARGCNESSDVDAVVAFGACVDAVTGGLGSEGSVRDGLGMLLGVGPDSRVTTTGLTLKDVVARLYREGRSQLIHGGRSPHFAEVQEDRTLGGIFSRRALLEAFEGITDYTASGKTWPDEYRNFMRTIDSLRKP